MRVQKFLDCTVNIFALSCLQIAALPRYGKMTGDTPDPVPAIQVKIADWNDQRTYDLVAAHHAFFTGIEADSTFSRPPSRDAYISKLNTPNTVLYVAFSRDSDQALGCGALRTFSKPIAGHDGQLTTSAGEVVSMHTLAESRGGGVGLAILRHIEHAARKAGLSRLYIETGRLDGYQSARRLYQRAGFEECGRFSEYGEHADVLFMIKEL